MIMVFTMVACYIKFKGKSYKIKLQLAEKSKLYTYSM